MKKTPENTSQLLLRDIKRLIEHTRLEVSQVVSSEVTALYWHIGNRVNNAILDNKRAEYGKQIVANIG